jgi:hypothetical protein
LGKAFYRWIISGVPQILGEICSSARLKLSVVSAQVRIAHFRDVDEL